MTHNESRIAFVTGAAGDIGRAVAEYLAGRGWTLALTDHPNAAARLTDTREACESEGALAWAHTFDVTDADATERAVAACCEELSTPTGVFNNAGYQGEFARVDRYPLADARRVFDVNVLGGFHTLAAVSAAMVAAGRGGAIVSSASMAGVSGAPNMAAYAASKAAVIGLTKSAAKDLAPDDIRVNAVSPAFIGPGHMWDNQVAKQAETASQYFSTDPAEVAEQMIEMIPLRRYGTTAEVAQVVAFLLSDDASYLTGVNIEIAGGM